MEAQTKDFPFGEGWTIERAENLLRSLPGVISVRLIARPGGEIEEIHLLTNEDVAPKQTVRNVESALLAHFDLALDHRKISVAQSKAMVQAVIEPPAPPAAIHEAVEEANTSRILFMGHQVESESSHRVRMKVTLRWKDDLFEGEASGTDLPRSRLEGLAAATLRAVETAIAPELEENGHRGLAMSLDGVTQVTAFDRTFILVAIHAICGREIATLAGASAVQDSSDRSVVLATLQATDRWVRGRL